MRGSIRGAGEAAFQGKVSGEKCLSAAEALKSSQERSFMNPFVAGFIPVARLRNP